jgi:hypothetical protein
MAAIAVAEVGTIRKSVGAIHMIAEHSLLERKVFNYLLKSAFAELGVVRRHKISILELARGVGTNSNNLDAIKDALRGLMTKPVEWNALSDGEEEWTATTGLASATFSRGICTYEYSEVLSEKLADPAIYSLIDLAIQQQFASRYSLSIYENCQRFVGVGSTGWWTLELFRGIAGVVGDDHPQFKYLRRDVIEPAIKEINAVSDIKISAEFKKTGRLTSHIKFSVKANRRGRLFDDLATEKARRSAAYRDMVALGLTDKAAMAALDLYDEGYLLEKIVLTQQLTKQGKVQNSGAFLAAALRDDYDLVVEQKVDETALAEIQSRRSKVAEENAAAERAVKAEKKARRDLVDQIEQSLAARSEKERKELESDFLARLSAAHRDLFRSQGYGILPMEKLKAFATSLETVH